MDIGSSGKYPSCNLSNFHAHRFVIDGVTCHSMEGFLQSLKFKSIPMQVEVCKLIGKGAKFKGKRKKWWRTQILYWQGLEMERKGDNYQKLLNKAYNAMYEQSEGFRKALHSTNGRLTHAMGKNDASRTVLTNSEFCGRLMKLRDNEKRLEPTDIEAPEFDFNVD